MKNTIITTLLAAAALTFSGCGKSDAPSGAKSSSGPSKASAETALSVKYKTDGATIIFTRNADGSKRRIDTIESDGTRGVRIMDRKGGADGRGVFLVYEDKAWREIARSSGGDVSMEAIRVEQGIGNAFASVVSDLTKYYTQAGFTKQPGQTIAGKSCAVYAGGHPENSRLPRYDALNFRGSHEEIAVWNGVTMRLKHTRTNSDGTKKETVVAEAQAVVTSVPDSAFTKTLDTPWIK